MTYRIFSMGIAAIFVSFGSYVAAADEKAPKGDAGVFDDAGEAADEEFGGGNKGDAEKDGKAKKGEDAPKEEDPPGEKDPKKEEDPEVGFGEGRAKLEADRAKGLDPAELESNKDLAKFVRILRKQLKKEEGYYLIRTSEMGIEADKQAAQGDRVAMKPYIKVDFEVLQGQEATIARVVKFLGEHDPPWEKKRPTRAKRGEAAALVPPKPKREWKFLRWFPESEQGQAAAEESRNRAQQEYDAQQQAIEERNKPRNNNR